MVIFGKGSKSALHIIIYICYRSLLYIPPPTLILLILLILLVIFVFSSELAGAIFKRKRKLWHM